MYFGAKVVVAWNKYPLMVSQKSKRGYYGLRNVLINTVWVGYEHG